MKANTRSVSASFTLLLIYSTHENHILLTLRITSACLLLCNYKLVINRRPKRETNYVDLVEKLSILNITNIRQFLDM